MFGFGFTITRDDISPAVNRLVAMARNPRAVLRAMGTTFKSITEGTFNSGGASYRPAPWKAKWGGQPSNLQQSTTLAKSFHLEVTDRTATVSNPMKYAAIHQFGGVIKPKGKNKLTWVSADGSRVFASSVTMPARPFFPVINNKLTPAAEEKILRAGSARLRAKPPGSFRFPAFRFLAFRFPATHSPARNPPRPPRLPRPCYRAPPVT